jgi:transcriptional regulator with XRE-family HTH domain
MLVKTLGSRIKEERLEKGLTGEKLGEILGVSRNAVSNWENNRRTPDNEILKKLSGLFSCTIDYLLGKTDIKNPYQNIDRVDKALEDDEELMEFWGVMKERESLQLMFKQVKNMSDKDIKQVMRIIKAIEDEEAEE